MREREREYCISVCIWLYSLCNIYVQQPARLEVEQRVGVSCVSSGPVFCRVSLDRGGYVPGETIGISATVSNRSKVCICVFSSSLITTSHNMHSWQNSVKPHSYIHHFAFASSIIWIYFSIIQIIIIIIFFTLLKNDFQFSHFLLCSKWIFNFHIFYSARNQFSIFICLPICKIIIQYEN